ncbi:MAG TPA: pyridoxal-phosphate dependent enzyme [Candidatus Dormibacteraeota bacterium]|nr:pyridoxal-phosphate dependent enzyme [Candidatus Dormibacteraeota bacterium]
MDAPGIDDIREAFDRIRKYLPETPLVSHPAFADALGLDAWLKLETAQPTGAFKVRGGVNWMSACGSRFRDRGVVTASTGNHGQSIAYAARLFSVPAVVYAPREANAFKVGAMRAMGAEVRLEGEDFQASVTAAEEAARREGMRFISSGDEPLLIAGVGTMALEAFARRPFDVAIVPVGGGSNAAGTALVAKALSPDTRVIAVCSAQAPAAHDAWHRRTHVRYETQSSVAEGLATRESYDLPQSVLARHLDEFALVDDAELEDALRFLAEHAHQLAEPAAVAGLAYARRHRAELAGTRVLLPITGANVTREMLGRILTAAE